MSELFNLPSGATTSDSSEYVRAWRELVTQVEKALPGWESYGFDPGVALARSDGRSGILSLPLDVAQRLAELVKGKP